MTLHLLPNLLGDDHDPKFNLVPGLFEVIDGLDGFFVENAKEARKYLKHFDFNRHRDKPMEIVDKNTKDFSDLLKPLLQGKSYGMITDAGLPCIADPGTRLVEAARRKNILVRAYPGPCSIILALMLSGFESQQFVFQGYIPRGADSSIRQEKKTQIFIETPYNNMKTLKTLLEILQDSDKLCVASDLMGSSQQVVSQSVKDWRARLESYDFHKRPSIFLIKTV